MQPYFFPYLGYFALVAATDYWIVFDEAQYRNRSWIARNRILNPNGGWQYITVPVQKHPASARIRDVQIITDDYWCRKLPNKLQYYRRRAPFYQPVMAMIEECLGNPPTTISALNVRCIEKCCAYFGVPFRFVTLSSLNLDQDNVHEPSDWPCLVGQQIGGTRYLNLPGGRDLYRKEVFEAAAIGLEFLAAGSHTYNQGRIGFEPNLSIIDVAMFNSPHRVREMLADVDWDRIV